MQGASQYGIEIASLGRAVTVKAPLRIVPR